MELASILRPNAIRTITTVSSKKRLLQEIADLTAEVFDVPAEKAAEALKDRETLGPTGVGKGIALPHARLHGLQSVIGTFIRLEKPVEFSSVDRKPVDLIFALFAPIDSGVDHLKALAVVSRTMRDGNTCAKLRNTNDISALHAILTETATSEAA